MRVFRRMPSTAELSEKPPEASEVPEQATCWKRRRKEKGGCSDVRERGFKGDVGGMEERDGAVGKRNWFWVVRRKTRKSGQVTFGCFSIAAANAVARGGLHVYQRVMGNGLSELEFF